MLRRRGGVSLFNLRIGPKLVSTCIIATVLLMTTTLVQVFTVPGFGAIPNGFRDIVRGLMRFFSSVTRAGDRRGPHFIKTCVFDTKICVFFKALFRLFNVR